MIGFEARERTTAPRRPRAIALRIAAVAGAILCAWISVDCFVNGGVLSGGSGSREFLLYWGVPFATVAAFLGWYAAGGSRRRVREVARSGCLGAILVGGVAFLVLLAGPMLAGRDTLHGAVSAFMYAPLAATLGLAMGLAGDRLRRRGR